MDNTNVNQCLQCKNCGLRDDGTVWTNRYDKASCAAYRYPNHKPVTVMNNLTECRYRKALEEKD